MNPAVGCYYFPPGLQLPSQPLRGLLPISLLGEQRHNLQFAWDCYPTASQLRFEPRPFCAWAQHANHSATEPPTLILTWTLILTLALIPTCGRLYLSCICDNIRWQVVTLERLETQGLHTPNNALWIWMLGSWQSGNTADWMQWTDGAYKESWTFASTTLSEMPTSVALPASHHFYPSLSPVVSLSLDVLHEWMRSQMLAKPSSNHVNVFYCTKVTVLLQKNSFKIYNLCLLKCKFKLFFKFDLCGVGFKSNRDGGKMWNGGHPYRCSESPLGVKNRITAPPRQTKYRCMRFAQWWR